MRLYSGARKGFGPLYVLPVVNSLEMGENGKEDKRGRESSYNRGLCECLSTAKDLNAHSRSWKDSDTQATRTRS